MDEKKLRENLTKKLIELGQLTHQMTRTGLVEDEQAIQMSNEISLLEKEIHIAGGKYVPTKDEMKCPGCLTSYEEGTIFCGNCGQNIKEFYESISDNCKVCGSIVKKDSKFCGVCGSKIII